MTKAVFLSIVASILIFLMYICGVQCLSSPVERGNSVNPYMPGTEQIFVTGFVEVRPFQNMGAPDGIYNPIMN